MNRKFEDFKFFCINEFKREKGYLLYQFGDASKNRERVSGGMSRMINKDKKGKLLFLSDEELTKIKMTQAERQVIQCLRKFLKNEKNPLMLIA